MLVAMPTILGAGALQAGELWRSGDMVLGYQALVAAALAFVSALIGVAAMMAWLRRASFTPFVIYRVIVGAALLVWAIYYKLDRLARCGGPWAAIAVEIGGNDALRCRRRHPEIGEREGVARDDIVALQHSHLIARDRGNG